MRLQRWMALTLASAALAACGDVLEPWGPGNLVPATVAEDPTLPAIDMNGSRFHLETVGDPADPVIVFLHGGPGEDYRGMLRLGARHAGYSLADDHFLVFWDQRGTGLSQRHGKSLLTIETYVADLDSLIARFSPGRPVILVGTSWGAMYATRFINEHPAKVAAAVLIEAGPLDGATMERIKEEIYTIDFGAEWLNDVAWSSQFLSPDDHARMDFQRLLGKRDGQPRFHQSVTDPEPVWRQGAAANRYLLESAQDARGRFDYDFTTDLSAFTTPVLFIAGERSEILGASLQAQQVQHYPAASLIVVPGVGHDVTWVKAADVVSHIRTYLDTVIGALP